MFLAGLQSVGYPSYVSRVPNGNVHGQATGHAGGSGAFRWAFQQAGLRWTPSLCQADTDGDGQSNGLELGDPCCVWTEGSTPAFTTDISIAGLASSTTSRAMPADCAPVPPAPPFPPPRRWFGWYLGWRPPPLTPPPYLPPPPPHVPPPQPSSPPLSPAYPHPPPPSPPTSVASPTPSPPTALLLPAPPLLPPPPAAPRASDVATCLELKTAYQSASCCGATLDRQTAYQLLPAELASASTTTTATCYDLKLAYQSSTCCAASVSQPTAYVVAPL